MNADSFEQYATSEEAVGDAKNWLKEQDLCNVMLWNDQPLVVTPPNFVNLTVAETEPGLRGDTTSGATKPATVETGAIIKVPLFVNQGELIKIDTRTGEYVSRVKA